MTLIVEYALGGHIEAIVLKKSEFSPARRFADVVAIAFECRHPLRWSGLLL
jgi:hypothetical protein